MNATTKPAAATKSYLLDRNRRYLVDLVGSIVNLRRVANHIDAPRQAMAQRIYDNLVNHAETITGVPAETIMFYVRNAYETQGTRAPWDMDRAVIGEVMTRLRWHLQAT